MFGIIIIIIIIIIFIICFVALLCNRQIMRHESYNRSFGSMRANVAKVIFGRAEVYYSVLAHYYYTAS